MATAERHQKVKIVEPQYEPVGAGLDLTKEEVIALAFLLRRVTSCALNNSLGLQGLAEALGGIVEQPEYEHLEPIRDRLRLSGRIVGINED